MRDEFAHCRDLVREQDRDRFLASLFAPGGTRLHLFALYAFNIELSFVGDRARDPLAGEARLQWWREIVSGNARENGAAHPVASALERTILEFGLPRARLVQMIEARMFDLFSDPMPTVQVLNAYLNETAVPMFSLAARIFGAKAGDNEAAAQHAGIAYGLTQLLRNFPFHASRGKIYMPLDVLQKHEVEPQAILHGEGGPALRAALAEIRALARERLMAAEAHVENLENNGRAAFLPLALVEPYLSRMERPDFDPFRTPAEIPQWRRQWALWRAARRF